MTTLNKTKLALLIAVLSSGGAIAQDSENARPADLANQSSVHDETIDAADDNWKVSTPDQAQEVTASDATLEEYDSAAQSAERQQQQSQSAERQQQQAQTDSVDASVDRSVAADSAAAEGDHAASAGTSAFTADTSTSAGSSEAEAKTEFASQDQEHEHIVHFPFDSAELTQEAKDKLDQAVEKMKGQEGSFSVTVAGHTDATGPEEYNKDLAERRAESVKQYLQESQLDLANIDVKAVGEKQPVASNENPSGREENRRVEISPAEGNSGDQLGATASE